MADTRYKVYDSNGKHKASCSEVEAAALLMSLYGEGSMICMGTGKGTRATLWTEGKDGCAADSYDLTAEVVFGREEKVAEWMKAEVDEWLKLQPSALHAGGAA